MTGFDPKIYRNLKDGVGSPGDPANTDSTSSWTMVALLKGIWAKLNVGVTVAGVAQDATLVSTNTKLDTLHTDLGTVNLNTDTLETLTGIVTETAPATDTASSGMNGRLQRIAQRITSLIALVPASLGQKAMSASLAVTVASDQSAIAVATHAVTQSGTWTVSVKDISNGDYETVAASQTAQALGATGATGDFIGGLLIIPATTSPGQVLLLDNATSITVFVGGATSVSNLVPFFVPLGMISVSGAWKVTTGTNVSVIGIGNFT